MKLLAFFVVASVVTFVVVSLAVGAGTFEALLAVVLAAAATVRYARKHPTT